MFSSRRRFTSMALIVASFLMEANLIMDASCAYERREWTRWQFFVSGNWTEGWNLNTWFYTWLWIHVKKNEQKKFILNVLFEYIVRYTHFCDFLTLFALVLVSKLTITILNINLSLGLCCFFRSTQYPARWAKRDAALWLGALDTSRWRSATWHPICPHCPQNGISWSAMSLNTRVTKGYRSPNSNRSATQHYFTSCMTLLMRMSKELNIKLQRN